jgi:hypothetical protein
MRPANENVLHALIVALTSPVASMLLSTAAYAEAVSPAGWKNPEVRYPGCPAHRAHPAKLFETDVE